MKKFLKIVFLLIINAGIGIVAIATLIGSFIAVQYVIVGWIETVLSQFMSPSAQLVLSIVILSLLVFFLLAGLGFKVRDKVEDIVQEIRLLRWHCKS